MTQPPSVSPPELELVEVEPDPPAPLELEEAAPPVPLEDEEAVDATLEELLLDEARVEDPLEELLDAELVAPAADDERRGSYSSHA